MHDTPTTQGTLVLPNEVFFLEVKEILSSGKDVLFTINGNSMRPFMSHGDRVLISPVKGSKLKLGQVVLANSQFGYVLHRLVWKTKSSLWLAGDNNLLQIEKVKHADVLGYGKYILAGEKKIIINSTSQTSLGLLWFLLRPLRLVVFKFRKFIK